MRFEFQVYHVTRAACKHYQDAAVYEHLVSPFSALTSLILRGGDRQRMEIENARPYFFGDIGEYEVKTSRPVRLSRFGIMTQF